MNTSMMKSITKDGDFNVNADDDPIKHESTSEEADGEFTQSSFPQNANLSSSQRDIERLPSKSTVFTHNKHVQKKSDSNLFDTSWAIFTHNGTYSHIVKKYFVVKSTTTNSLLPTDNDRVINHINNGDDDAPMNHDNDYDDNDDDDDEPLSKSFVKLHPNSSLSSLKPKGFKFSFDTKKQQNQLSRNREKIKTLQQEFRRLKQRNIELKNIIKSI